MRALTYHGPNDVRVDNVPEPKLEAKDDVILKVTATAICGSDLHLYRGKVPQTEPGDIFGHEFMGVVEEVGPEVTAVKKGDRVVIPFVIACGQCFFCQHDMMAACETTNDGPGGTVNPDNSKLLPPPAALFGFSHLYGGVPGGQAEYVRVPKGNFNPFKIEGSLPDEKVLFLSDILPTAWQAVVNADVKKGSTVAIFGAGPIGLLAAACSKMLGAEQIFMVDHHAYRLKYATETYGVIPVNFDTVNVTEFILEKTAGHRGVDSVIDAVGFEAKGSTADKILTTLKLEDSSGAALKDCIAAVRRGGNVSVPGVYVGGIHNFLLGDAFDKGLTFKLGQTHVHKYLPQLLEFIENGDLSPEAIITHRLNLSDAAKGYDIFSKREEECRKVIMTP